MTHVHAMTRRTTVLLIMLLGLCTFAPTLSAANPPATATAKPAVQTTYASAEDAVADFVDAIRSADPARLHAVLGPGSEKLINSGDRQADAENRKWFVDAYQEKHTLIPSGPDSMVLTVGNDAWPMPIPVVRTDGRWRFDSAIGAQELVDRRIGRNEIAAIRSALAYVDAQRAYRAMSEAQQGDRWTYAQRMISQRGKRDGLYWPADADGADQSPLAELVADAREHGYPVDYGTGKTSPYQGYLFRILKAQGPNAPGGAMNYVTNGRMTKGFGLVAWPAIYGSSGIMTFQVNQDGIVYQKDLGPRTAAIAEAMTRFDPDLTWARIDISNE